MNNNLQVFKNNEFGEIRTAVINNEPYLMLNDVCRVLDIKNSRDVSKRLNRDGVDTTDIIDSLGRKQQATFINESNFYKVVFQSRKPQAEIFTEYVTSEILPSIRQHGAYLTDEKIEEVLMDPDTIIKLATQLKKEREEKKKLQERAKQDKPKVLFADAVTASHTSILVGELAKLLKQNGIDTGQNRLFEWLRNNSYLIRRKGTDYNMPTQKSMDLELFEVKETSITHSDGHISVNKTPKVTGKGQVYFINKFKEKQDSWRKELKAANEKFSAMLKEKRGEKNE